MSLDHITLTKLFRPGTPVVINVEEYEDTDAGVFMPAFTVDATVREVTDAGVVVEYYWFSEPQVVTRTPESLTITPPPLESDVPLTERIPHVLSTGMSYGTVEPLREADDPERFISVSDILWTGVSS